MTSGMIILVSLIGILTLGVVLLTSREVVQWYRKRSILTFNQMIFRLFGGILTVGLLVKVIIGVFYVHMTDDTERFLIFWKDCLGLALLVVVVALIDFYYVMKFRRTNRTRIQEWLRNEKSALHDAGDDKKDDPDPSISGTLATPESE